MECNNAQTRSSVPAGTVNVLDLGVRNDGSADVSDIVNAATEQSSLYFPAGLYKVSKPIVLKHSVFGAGYSRSNVVDPTRTWFVSDLKAVDDSVGVFNWGGNVQVNVENLNLKCTGGECGLRIDGCVQNTYTWIKGVGIYGVQGTGLYIDGGGSRPIFVTEMTIWGSLTRPDNSRGILVKAPPDCRFTNIEVMGTCIGFESWGGHTYGENMHLWTGIMGGKERPEWWEQSRGLLLRGNSGFHGSQIYPDTSYYAIDLDGPGAHCTISELLYWEDGSIANVKNRTGVFIHRAPGTNGKAIIHGGLVGVGGDDEHPGATQTYYAPGNDIRDVLILSNYAIKGDNLDRLCFGDTLPDYTIEYAEKGYCRVADIFAAAETGACEATLVLDDGAAWRLTFAKGADGKISIGKKPLNALCAARQIATRKHDGLVTVYVNNPTDAPFTTRVTTAYMTARFRPLDYGLLRTTGRAQRYREVLPASSFATKVRSRS